MFFMTRTQLMLLCLILLLTPACRGKPAVVRDAGTDEQAFKRAMELYSKKNYFDAKPAFTDLRDKFPLSPYAVTAELRLADIHYFNEEFVEAIHFYEEFKRLHPSNPDVPYAIFQLGMCHFKQLESFDRDQSPAEKASGFFEYMIKNYPDSPFTGSAMGYYKICRQRMFDHDLSIGQFYYKTKKYWAAKERLVNTVSQYSFISNRDEALYYLGLAYRQLNEPDKARETLLSLLQEYPGSPFGTEAQALLETSPEKGAAEENAAPEGNR